MFTETRLNSRQVVATERSSALEFKKPDPELGWYSPETLSQLQRIFDAVWLDVHKSVFPWDVHATRETIAVLVFEHVRDPTGEVEHIIREVLQSVGTKSSEPVLRSPRLAR